MQKNLQNHVESLTQDLEHPSHDEVVDRLDALWAEESRADLPTFVPERVDRYSIQRLIGRGAFGIVCLAHDELLDRQVAIKLARPEVLDDQERLIRFKEEARLTASLSHPYIVPLYEAKLDRDIPFLASAYCPGPDLGAWLEQNQSTIASDDAAAFVKKLAEAVQYAHEKGILHRDLKPSNILLDFERSEHEVASLKNTRPKLTDFGLAKSFGDSVVDTRSSLMIGTPLYMAPEQLDNNPVDASDVSVDIYALGCLLYELLAGRTPILGESYIEVIDGIRNTIPPRLREFREDAPKDLETICEKCLEKLPADRYQSAKELAEELNRFLHGEQVQARPLGKIDRFYRRIKKHRLLSFLISIAAILLIILFGLTTIYQNSLATVENTLQKVTSRAEQRESEVSKLNHSLAEIEYAGQITRAFDAYNKKDFAAVENILALTHNQNPDLINYPWHALQSLVKCPKPLELEGHKGPVREIAKVPGKRQLASVGDDGTIRIWNCDTGELLNTIKASSQQLSALAIAPDGGAIATGTHTLSLWDPTSQNSKSTSVWFNTTIEEISFSDDGKRIACGARNSDIVVYTIETGQTVRIDSGAGNESILFTGNDILGFKDTPRRRHLTGWDSATGEISHSYKSAQNLSPNGIAFNKTKNLIAVSDTMQRSLFFCDPTNGKQLFRSSRNVCPYTDVAFSSDGNVFFAGDQRGNLHMLDVTDSLGNAQTERFLESQYSQRYIPAHNQKIHSLSIIDEQHIGTAAEDGVIKIWQVPNESNHYIQPLPQQVYRMRLTGEGDYLLCLLRSNEFKLINQRNNESYWKVTNPRKPSKNDGRRGTFKISNDGMFFASYGIDNNIDLWELKSGKHITDFQLENTTVDLSFSSDNRWMVAAGVDGYVAVWDLASFERLFSFNISGWATSSLFSPNDKYLAIGGRESRIFLINTADWRVIHEMISDSGVHSMAFSPIEDQLATAHGDGSIHVWDYKHANHITTLRGHTTNHIRLAYHPADEILVTASEFGELLAWDLKTEKLLGSLWKGKIKENIRNFGFTRDGSCFYAHLTTGEVSPGDSALLYINLDQEP